VTAAGLGTWHWDMHTGEMAFNDRLLTMLGYRHGELNPTISAWSNLVHPDDQVTWQQALRLHLDDPDTPCRAELRVRRPDGDWAAVLSCGVVISRNAQGQPEEMAGINIDLTEQMQMQAMLRHAARTDGLTQLPNWAAVFDHVQQVIDRAASQPDFGYAVLFMDFDRFKQINDTLGHSAGDELLRQIAQRLRRALRNGDAVRQGASYQHTAGRIGGDGFVVVLEGVRGRDEAAAVAKRLMEVLSAPYALGQNQVHSSASIGIVTSELSANDANTVMREADTAMYEAKRAGRGRWVIFDPVLHERVVHGMALEQDLRQALALGQLFVVYQPVISLHATGHLHVEALVRWQHPQRGMISPVEFIPVAEDTGLILPLGAWVLEAACRQFMAWQVELGPLAPRSVAVNLSPRQLQAPGLTDMVQQCLVRTRMPPTKLQLEVTESLAAQDEQARAGLRALKALGLRIALDDFGTGNSSLACLHLLPVDIDYHRVLIEATIRVAQTLGMDTVAEGIETEGQAALMRRLQCDRGQGFLFSPPLTAEALVAWLHAGAAAPQQVTVLTAAAA
jgi:diguanylate cyclase (GGDEF)-like protein/PAS domain S-box-containing protein